ncbi:MAG: type II and III secretion system protein family protein [Thermodesulfobacteriota bacterium]|nr:type II and III secretion system protein family protein [Thermodesulfobacteriota bacterium]
MRTSKKIRLLSLLAAFAVLFAALSASPALCKDAAQRPMNTQSPQIIELVLGKSIIVNSETDIHRVSVAEPGIADILLLSPKQVCLTGKAPGVTNLTLWDQGDRVARVFDLNVTPDVSQLKEMIHTLLPEEKDIQVIAAHDSLTLSGAVSSAANQALVLDVAEVYAPNKVVNLMHVGGSHQVMLEVKVAEMSRSVMERLGIDFSYFMGGDFFYVLLNNLIALDNESGPLPITPWQRDAGANGNLRISPARNGMFRFHKGQAVWSGFLDVLKNNGLVKILAEPSLLCRSGEDAEFLAGGEIPIPVPQGLGSTAIEYKQFGVALSFSPMVLDNNKISLKVFPEVSELDYNNAVNIGGYTIPAITSRRASTTVELGDGQSFAIAGLLKDDVREGVNKYPVLGDIPVLGTLFRSSSYQKQESELVIIVTPHLAKPLDMAEQSLPTDQFTEPTEMEFFLLGLMQGKGSNSEPVSERPAVPARGDGPRSGMDGEFGHILPPH